jgi:hypothetical protein
MSDAEDDGDSPITTDKTQLKTKENETKKNVQPDMN